MKFLFFQQQDSSVKPLRNIQPRHRLSSSNWSNLLRLLLLFQLIEMVMTKWIIAFSYNNSNYTVSSLPNDSPNGIRTQDKFASKFKSDFEKANCGNVIWSDSTVEFFDILWNKTICKGYGSSNVITFGRAINNLIQEWFENCTINTLKNSGQSTENETCLYYLPVIIIGAVLGGLSLVGFVASIYCCFKDNCCKSRRQYDYDSDDDKVVSIKLSINEGQSPQPEQLEERVYIEDMPEDYRERLPILGKR